MLWDASVLVSAAIVEDLPPVFTVMLPVSELLAGLPSRIPPAAGATETVAGYTLRALNNTVKVHVLLPLAASVTGVVGFAVWMMNGLVAPLLPVPMFSVHIAELLRPPSGSRF